MNLECSESESCAVSLNFDKTSITPIFVFRSKPSQQLSFFDCLCDVLSPE